MNVLGCLGSLRMMSLVLSGRDIEWINVQDENISALTPLRAPSETQKWLHLIMVRWRRIAISKLISELYIQLHAAKAPEQILVRRNLRLCQVDPVSDIIIVYFHLCCFFCSRVRAVTVTFLSCYAVQLNQLSKKKYPWRIDAEKNVVPDSITIGRFLQFCNVKWNIYLRHYTPPIWSMETIDVRFDTDLNLRRFSRESAFTDVVRWRNSSILDYPIIKYPPLQVIEDRTATR